MQRPFLRLRNRWDQIGTEIMDKHAAHVSAENGVPVGVGNSTELEAMGIVQLFDTLELMVPGFDLCCCTDHIHSNTASEKFIDVGTENVVRGLGNLPVCDIAFETNIILPLRCSPELFNFPSFPTSKRSEEEFSETISSSSI